MLAAAIYSAVKSCLVVPFMAIDGLLVLSKVSLIAYLCTECVRFSTQSNVSESDN